MTSSTWAKTPEPGMLASPSSVVGALGSLCLVMKALKSHG